MKDTYICESCIGMQTEQRIRGLFCGIADPSDRAV